MKRATNIDKNGNEKQRMEIHPKWQHRSEIPHQAVKLVNVGNLHNSDKVNYSNASTSSSSHELEGLGLDHLLPFYYFNCPYAYYFNAQLCLFRTNNLIPNGIQQGSPSTSQSKFCPNVTILVNHDIHTTYI